MDFFTFLLLGFQACPIANSVSAVMGMELGASCPLLRLLYQLSYRPRPCSSFSSGEFLEWTHTYTPITQSIPRSSVTSVQGQHGTGDPTTRSRGCTGTVRADEKLECGPEGAGRPKIKTVSGKEGSADKRVEFRSSPR